MSVTKVKGSKAYYEADEKTKTFRLTGKYGCGCAGDCCNMVSQKPGKCPCGKELVKNGKPAWLLWTQPCHRARKSECD